MKLRFYCDSGANIHSCRSEDLDLEKDLGLTDVEWNSMSASERQKLAEEWAYDRLDIGYEVLEDEE